MGSRARNATASALAAADGAARAAARGGMGAAADFYTPAAARAAAPDAARGAAGLFAPRLAPSADARAAGAGAEGGVSNEVEPGPTNEVEPGPAERSGEESKKKGLSYLALFRYADRIDLILAAAGSVAGAANGVALPAFALIFGDLMDSLNDLTDVRAAVDDNIKWLGVLAGGTLVAGFAQVSCWTLTGERLMGHVRERYLHAALRQDATYYETVRSAEQTFALLGPEVASMTDAVGQNVGLSIQYCVTFVAGLIIAFIRGWRVALVVLAFVPLFVGVLATLGLLLMNAAKKSSEAYSSAATIASGATNAIREVLSATANTFLSATYQDALQPARVSDRTEGIARGSIWGGFFFLMFATYGAVLWIGGIWVADGTMTGGEVITAFFSAMIGGIILGQLAPIGTSMIAGLPAAARLYALIDRVPDVDIEAPGQELKAVEGSITMRGVHFAYPSRPQTEVLRNFDLEIAAGQTVALVGESGSGKSTVIQLVERFYDPSSGSISLDGVDLRRLQVKWLRSQMGLVSQEPVLFSGSIRDNICYGRPDASDADVEAAARAANAHSFINELGQGYDTFCGEGGRALSGGQKQRVAIARALLRKPAVLLLDEATSALDAESEALVQQALEALMAQHTTLLIAHRLSTVRNADRIVVMARGEAVESGTHDQLVAANGAYAQLVQLQQVVFSGDASHRASRIRLEALASPTDGSGETAPGADSSVHGGGDSEAAMTKNECGSGVMASLQIDSETASANGPVDIGESDRSTVANAGDNGDGDGDLGFDHPRYTLWRFALPYWHYGLAGFIGAGCIGAAFPILAMTMSEIFDTYYLDDPSRIRSEAAKWGGIMLGVGGGIFVAAFVANAATGIGGGLLTMRVRMVTFTHILRQEVGWFDTHQTAELASQLESDAKAVQVVAGQRVGILIQGLVTLVLGMVLAFTAGWQLALVVLAIFPLLGVAGYLEMQTMGKSMMANKGAGKSLDDFAAEEAGERQTARGVEFSGGRPGLLASEAILNVRTVASSTAEKGVEEAYAAALRGPKHAAYRNAQIAGAGYGLCYAIIFGSYALAFWYGGVLIDRGTLTFQQVLEVFFALVISATTISQSQAMMPDWAKTSAAVNNIFALLNRRSRIDAESMRGCTLDTVRGELALRSVRFRYPARPDREVLKALTLDVLAGQTVALVGESGSGKSTVIQLVERFYDPSSGSISLDGVDLRRLQVKWLRSQMGLVSQEPVLFSGSIRDNICYGRPDASDADVEAAARAANAHSFINELGQGYDTFCGEGGRALSGGQKQRVAIARALLRKPAVLLLDEATSALDAESEALVQQALEALMAQHTTLLIAHRLSTVRNADRIVVMARGEAVESGTHDQLVAANGAYAQLVQLQMAGSTTSLGEA